MDELTLNLVTQSRLGCKVDDIPQHVYINIHNIVSSPDRDVKMINRSIAYIYKRHSDGKSCYTI